MLLLPLVFIGEGMFDQWFVAAYLPLALATANGFAFIARRWKVVTPGALATAVAWMILANYADLNFRRYDYAEVYGRLLMKDVAPGAAFVTSTDDGTVIPMYLQEVKGERPDLKLVHGEFLGVEWYDRRLESQTGLKPPQPDEIRAKTNPSLLYITAFANANVAPGKPVYSERPTDPNGLRPGLSLVAVGSIWKTAVSAEAAPTPAGKPDVDPEAVARQRRRARGIYMRHLPTGMVARYEPYEDRLVDLIVQPRLREARPLLELNPGAALGLYERARRIDGALEVDAAFQYDYGLALYLKDRFPEAAEAFEKVLQLEPSPQRETLAHFYLAEIARAAQRRDDAKRHYEAALRIRGADEGMMLRIRARAEQP
jgi:TolA-binding protein